MPQVTINEIDQSRYVMNSQRAPLIALVPIISSFGDTESATLIENESQYNLTFGTELASPIEGDITRKYALNLINAGIPILAKRIKPTCDFEEGKSATLDSLYANLNVGVGVVREEPEETFIELSGYRATDGTFYVPIGTVDNPSYTHYDANNNILEPRYEAATENTEGKLEVVANDTATTTTIYAMAETEDTNKLEVVANNTTQTVTTYTKDESVEHVDALEVVANDASEFDPTTQVKLETVESQINDIQVGDYVTVETSTVDTFDPTTQVKLETVESIVDGVQIGDYVKVIETTTDTFDPTTQVRLATVQDEVPNVIVGSYVVLINGFNTQEVQEAIQQGIYTPGTISVLAPTEEPEETEETEEVYKYRLNVKARYFGSYGNNIGIRMVKESTNENDILSRESKNVVTILTYRVTKRSTFSENEGTEGVNPKTGTMSNADIKQIKQIDSITLDLADTTADNSVTKLNQLMSELTLLSSISITKEDGTSMTLNDYQDFFSEVSDNMLTDSIFMLTGGADYFTKITETVDNETVTTVSPSTEPLTQFYNTLAEVGMDNSYSNINLINDFWEDFKDPYIYDFDFICSSGFTNRYSKLGEELDTNPELRTIHANMIKLAYSRGDAVALLDSPKEYTHKDVLDYYASLSNSDVAYSYAAAHGPWCKIRDITTGNLLEVPASLIFLATIGANLARNSEAQIWYAPAGVSRANSTMVVTPRYEIGSTILNEWQNTNPVRINPIMKILSYGYTIYGNSTLMQDETGYTKSALQSLGTRVLCNVIKKAIFSICVALTFEPNDYILWAEFKTRLSKTLEQMKVNGGIGDYQIVMDDSTVTEEAKNDLKVPGKVFISPTRPAEYFDIDFTITQSGVTFDESVSGIIE